MAKFVYLNHGISDRFVNVDLIESVFLRQEATDSDAEKLYFEETGLDAPVMHEIVLTIGGKEYVYSRIHLDDFEKAAKSMNITCDDVANMYLAALIHYDFRLTIEQFLWIILEAKSSVDELAVGEDIYKIMIKAYEETHCFYEDTVEFKDIQGYTSRRVSDFGAHFNPKGILEDKRDKFHKWN